MIRQRAENEDTHTVKCKERHHGVFWETHCLKRKRQRVPSAGGTVVAEDETRLRGGEFYPNVMQALWFYKMSTGGNIALVSFCNFLSIPT